jgi:hypothetical protein
VVYGVVECRVVGRCWHLVPHRLSNPHVIVMAKYVVAIRDGHGSVGIS